MEALVLVQTLIRMHQLFRVNMGLGHIHYLPTRADWRRSQSSRPHMKPNFPINALLKITSDRYGHRILNIHQSYPTNSTCKNISELKVYGNGSTMECGSCYCSWIQIIIFSSLERFYRLNTRSTVIKHISIQYSCFNKLWRACWF